MNEQCQRLPIYIVERHELSRTGFRLIFEKDQRLKVVGEAADLQEAFDDIKLKSPSVVMIGIEDPDRDANLCVRIKESLPNIQLLALFDSVDYANLCLFLGSYVSGFSSRSVDVESLLLAVHALTGGSLWFSPIAANALTESFSIVTKQSNNESIVQLTDREREILKRLVRGFTNPQIAEELQLSIETIKTYIRRIMDKSSIRSRRELMIRYRRFGSLIGSSNLDLRRKKKT